MHSIGSNAAAWTSASEARQVVCATPEGADALRALLQTCTFELVPDSF